MMFGLNNLKKRKNGVDFIMLNINFAEESPKENRCAYCANRVKLSDIADGETFKIGDIEFIKFPQIDGYVPVVAKECIESMEFNNRNNLRDNDAIITRLDEFLDEIASVVGKENFLEFETDLLTLDGSEEYGKMISKVSLPTLDFYRANRKIFDKHKIDECWWLATADSIYNDLILCITQSGCVNYGIYFSHSCGVRPLCVLKSNTLVSRPC